MKIAVVCSDMGIRVPGDKGASIHLQSITKAFASLGHDVLLLGVAGHGEPPSTFAARLIRHPGRSEGLRRELRKIRFNERFFRHNAESLRAFAPEIVYERLALFGTAGMLLADTCAATHVVEVNALLSREEKQWRGLHLAKLAEKRERMALDHAALRVAVSREVAAQVDQVSPHRRTVVVPNGVERELFGQLPERSVARERLGLPADRYIVGFTGALRPWHGLDVALRALALLDDRHEVAIAGEGPLRAELEALAASLGITHRVHWLGRVPHSYIPQVLAALDIAVAPYPELTTFSFSPLKLYEYLASGTPVVASAIGQVSEILGAGALGALTTPGDPVELAGAIRRITDDQRPARERATAARAVALADHGWENRAVEIILHAREAADALAR